MKRTAWLAAFAGLFVLIGLVAVQGAGDVLAILSQAGWVLLWLVPLHFVPLALDAKAWNVLLVRTASAPRNLLPFLVWIAAVREAVNRLLPTVSIGGELVGIRLAKLRFPDSVVVTATIVVEVLLTVVAQYIFAAGGVVLMLAAHPELSQVWSIGTALVLSLPLPFAFAWLLHSGRVFERLHGFASRLLGEASQLVARMEGVRLDGEIRRLFGAPRVLGVALAWQLCGFVVGSLETWFALMVLGHPISLGAAVAVESLSQAIRNVIFIVPGGLGVQEAAVMLFARLVGVEGDIALTLALVKRMREILFGIPALLSWQWVEASTLRSTLGRPNQPVAAPLSSRTET
jgi:putative membrane protein